MKFNTFEAYLTSHNVSITGKGGKYTAVRNDDPSKTIDFTSKGSTIDDSLVKEVCAAVDVTSPV